MLALTLRPKCTLESFEKKGSRQDESQTEKQWHTGREA